MSMVKGRLDDFIVLRHGRRISPQVFYYTVAPIGGVSEWRVIQESIEELKVEIVAARGPKQGRRRRRIKRRIEENLKESVGNGIKLTVEIVNSIPKGPGEKFRSVFSLVDKKSL